MNSMSSTADFYIWKSPEKGGTGHLGTGYTTPQESRYHAIQPGRSVLSLIAPTIFGAVTGMPCPSQAVDSLSQDIDNEGANPDYIVHIPADSPTIQKMQGYMQGRKGLSANGLHLYNLAPNAPWAFNGLRAAASSYPTPMYEGSPEQEIALARGSALPLSEDEQTISDTLDSVTMGHCATEGVNVARVMGIDINHTNLPFDYNPEMVGEMLKRIPGARVEYPPQSPASWEGACRYT